jgi:hypothetical protein
MDILKDILAIPVTTVHTVITGITIDMDRLADAKWANWHITN